MSSSLTLSSSDLSTTPLDRLLNLVRGAASVTLHLDQPLHLDAVRVAMIVATISQGNRSLSITFPGGHPQASVIASLHHSLLSPVIWGADPPSPYSMTTKSILPSSRIVTDPATKTICVHTSRLPLNSRESFQAAFERLCRAASILVPGSVYGAVATIAFETTSNAEEYGAFALAEAESPVALRYLIARLHDKPPLALSSSAALYLESYLKSGHSPSTRWLELLVVDAGVGISYPSYYVFASNKNWPKTDVFEEPFDVERARMQLVLNTGESTKGRWGRIVNAETARGEGTLFIRIRLSAVRGYLALHSGRGRAEWWHAQVRREPSDIAAFPPYEVTEDMSSPFRGTVWHVLVPLDAQLTLPLDHG